MNKAFWGQIWWLLVFTFFGFLVVMFIMTVSFGAFGKAFGENAPVAMMHFVQWMQTLFVMALPPMLWARIYMKEDISSALGLRFCHWKYFAWTLLLMAALLPLLELLYEGARIFPWPDFLRRMGDEQYESQQQLLETMLSPGGVIGWIELFLLMCLGTAIGEELMFRGALLRCFDAFHSRLRPGMQRHFTAIVVGLIFALIHFDFYGLLPRWILGTVFVYLVFWSGSLWSAVLAHTLNNLVALLMYKSEIFFEGI